MANKKTNSKKTTKKSNLTSSKKTSSNRKKTVNSKKKVTNSKKTVNTKKKVLKPIEKVEEKKIIKLVPSKISIYLLIVGILLCLSLILAVSYSAFEIDSKQGQANEITVGCFTINFIDSGTSNSHTNLSITNSYPISTEAAIAKNPYKFTITNICDYTARTTIAINVLKTSSISALATSQGKTIGDMLNIAFKEGTGSVSAPVTLSSLNTGTIRANDTATDVSYILRVEDLEKNVSKTYSIWMWVPESINDVEVGNEAQGLTLYSTVDVYSQAVTSTSANNG